MDGFGQPLDQPTPKERGALDSLFRRHYRWLAAALRRRYGAETAEDLAQETYLKLLRGGRAETVQHPRALLMQIARNVATDQFRRSRREVAATAPLPDLDQLSAQASQIDATLVKQIVLALPQKLRDVFVLNQVEGLTHQEIAQLLGISVKTVEWRMRKALARCAAAIRE